MEEMAAGAAVDGYPQPVPVISGDPYYPKLEIRPRAWLAIGGRGSSMAGERKEGLRRMFQDGISTGGSAPEAVAAKTCGGRAGHVSPPTALPRKCADGRRTLSAPTATARMSRTNTNTATRQALPTTEGGLPRLLGGRQERGVVRA